MAMINAGSYRDAKRALTIRIHNLTQTPGWNVEGYGSRLIVYRHDQLIKPKNLQDFIVDCEAIAHVFIPSWTKSRIKAKREVNYPIMNFWKVWKGRIVKDIENIGKNKLEIEFFLSCKHGLGAYIGYV